MKPNDNPIFTMIPVAVLVKAKALALEFQAEDDRKEFIWRHVLLVLARLLRAHPEVHRRLGSPSVIAVEGEESEIVTTRYILSGEYVRLNDPQLNGLGNMLRAGAAFVFVTFGLFIVLVLAYTPTRAFLGLECFKQW